MDEKIPGYFSRKKRLSQAGDIFLFSVVSGLPSRHEFTFAKTKEAVSKPIYLVIPACSWQESTLKIDDSKW
ncbi:MAG: hypothetical protein WBC65_12610, partial [Ignavibacteria bacterium]